MREVTISEAISRRFPEQLFLLSSVDKDGNANIMTIGWCMLTSFDPFMVAISVCKERYSHSLISENGEFTLAFPTEDMKEKVLYCGTHSGRDVDKLKESGLIVIPAKKVKAPLIDKCNVNLECKVISKLDTGSNTIFVGEILVACISELPGKGLYSLGGDRYGSI
jgi:flavin reductase (DIM6/NTAB) family NADH-FMN oxidoreductase RutF